MFVNSRLSSLAAARPICNCTRAAHARVFRACNSIHDFKPIEFSFFLTQHSTYLYFISFLIYVTLPIFFFISLQACYTHAFVYLSTRVDTAQHFSKDAPTLHRIDRETVFGIRHVSGATLSRAWQYCITLLRCNARRVFLRSFSTNARTHAGFCALHFNRCFFRAARPLRNHISREPRSLPLVP